MQIPHHTAEELKELIDSGGDSVSDRLINIDAFFTYLDEMEANLGDIHCDITKDVLIRSQARNWLIM